jgi:integrase
MEWEEIAHDVWAIPATKTKNGEVHVLPLPKAALEIISSMPRATPYVLGSPPTGFSKIKARLDKASGVTTWTFHDLRRTMASVMPALGVDAVVVEMLLNHRLPTNVVSNVGAVYNRHKYLPEMRAALDSWSTRVAARDDAHVPAE